ncbi:MAG: YoaK family protein, partial [Solirubrobacteraceae bacterium]
GVPGFSIARTVIAVLAFAIGSAAGGQLSRRWRRQPFIWMRRATGIEIALLLLALLASVGLETGIHTPDQFQRLAVVALLGFTMGMRNATVRRLGFSDVPTTVLTSTITDLASQSRFGGGERRRQKRRAAAIAAMTAGALVGALLVRHADPHWALVVAIGLLVAGAVQQAVTARRYPHSSYPPAAPSNGPSAATNAA